MDDPEGVVISPGNGDGEHRLAPTPSAKSGTDEDRMRAVLRLIGPQEITPLAERMILEIWDAEARPQRTGTRAPETEDH